MPTFVSMITWTGDPQPRPGDVLDQLGTRSRTLREAGLHSLVFLPDEGACAAIMVAACEMEPDVERLAAAILRGATVHVEAMKFEDGPAATVRHGRQDVPPPASSYLSAVLEAVVTG